MTGTGEDAGVVYCEMQARENSGESLTHLAMLRDMYPGECGFKSETGGIMANLRDSTSHKKVDLKPEVSLLIYETLSHTIWLPNLYKHNFTSDIL